MGQELSGIAIGYWKSAWMSPIAAGGWDNSLMSYREFLVRNRARFPKLFALGDAAHDFKVRLASHVQAARTRHPRTAIGLAIATALCALIAVGATTWLVVG